MKLIPLGILVSLLVVPFTFGQCPPVPEGSLPQSAEIARVTVLAPKKSNPATHVPDKVLIPVDLTKKSRIIAESTVLSSEAKTPPIRPTGKKKGKVGAEDKFAGPIAIPVPGAGTASAIVEQDGRFIIAGGSDTSSGQGVDQGLFLARFEADGTPDPTFGQGGSIRITLFAQNNLGNVSPPCLALSPDGKIVVARTISDLFEGNEPGTRVALARLDHDGSLDPTFGSGGLVYTTIKNNFSAHAVAVQRDDRIIIAGQSGHTGSAQDEPIALLATLVRYQSNGQLDPTFGNLGVVRTLLFVGGFPPVLSNESLFSDVIVQENGLIVAAGEIKTGTGSGKETDLSRMLIAEYLPTGELNPAFASSGAVMLDFAGPYQKFGAASLVIRENGRILVGGSASSYGYEKGLNETFLVDQAFVFAQLTLGGDLDATFGNAGKVVVNVHPETGGSPSLPLDHLNKVMLDPAGDVYAAGMASGPVGASEKAVVIVALHGDGSLKQNFGNAGQFSFGTYSPWHLWLAQDALLTSGGRLVVSGTHWPDHLPDAFVLWAYSVKPGPAGCP